MCKCKFGACPDSCKCRCHLAIEAHCDHSYKVGISSGLERAAGMLMKQASDAFTRGRDAEAKLLRFWAENLENAGKEAHPGPTPTYPEEETK